MDDKHAENDNFTIVKLLEAQFNFEEIGHVHSLYKFHWTTNYA